LGNKKITKDDVLKMRQILKDVGSYDYVVNLGWKYVEEGKKQIPLITSSRELRAILESLIVYMMERVK
jgi:geranylgeranyl pyrophosphate synthase